MRNLLKKLGLSSFIWLSCACSKGGGGDGHTAPELGGLLTDADLDGIKALVEPRVEVKECKPLSDFSFSDQWLQDYAPIFNDFVNTTMKRDDLKPGRNFETKILDDLIEGTNAHSCDQFLGISAGLIKLKNPKLVAAVMCHEMIHSARNSSVRCVGAKSKIEALNCIRREESFADVLGGILCGKVGLGPEEYIGGIRKLFETFFKERMDDNTGKHPSGNLRLSQLERFKSRFILDTTSSIYSKFGEEFSKKSSNDQQSHDGFFKGAGQLPPGINPFPEMPEPGFPN